MTNNHEAAGTVVHDKLAVAIAESMPTDVTARRSTTVVSQPERGNLIARLFEDREDKRHRDVLRVTHNVAVEAVHAQIAVGVIATSSFDTTLEVEAGFEQTIMRYQDSQIAMAAAPAHVQLARNLLAAGMQQIGDAAIRHVTTKIAGR